MLKLKREAIVASTGDTDISHINSELFFAIAPLGGDLAGYDVATVTNKAVALQPVKEVPVFLGEAEKVSLLRSEFLDGSRLIDIVLD